MNTRCAVLAGVGGQGAILTAKVFVNGLMEAGYDVKMSEVHGMSQRGEGAADILLAFEVMEAVRYSKFLKPDGTAVINDFSIAPMPVAAGLAEYPAGCLEAMQKTFRCYTLNAADIAMKLGSAKCMNIVLFGAMIRALGMDHVNWEEVIRKTVPAKFLDLNLAAYQAGYDAVKR